MSGAAQSDTIAAVATPPGRSGIGVLRISGPGCRHIARQMIGELPPPRHASFRGFRDAGGGILDRGIVLFFPGPHSYTGEDVLELQGHGGDVVMRLLLQAALDLGARQARPGEFTERAFLNDRIDLLQAEATADLIESVSAAAARSAMRSLEGAFSQRVNSLQQSLTDLRVRVEGALDFPDEDVDAVIGVDLTYSVQEQLQIIDELQLQADQGRLLRSGIDVVIVGSPNVGKSSLINKLVEREAAIVTDIPGTTRDPVREICMIDGLQVTLTDTAGLRESEDRIEQEGVRRAGLALVRADVVLWVHDDQIADTDSAAKLRQQMAAGAVLIEVNNKIDRLAQAPYRQNNETGTTVIGLSALIGDGLDYLRETIRECVGYNPAGEDLFAARERHVRGLADARGYADRALQAIKNDEPLEVIAENLRHAQQSLAVLTGQFSADDLLGEIFSRFCIGK
ncbi:MAG: tRNA uridine-5-carboxymethylaminomethyl(34) synthesis GTPase MnmE [Gammaproteobacteria bacterium]|nr:tRNA uridine-5-carboxymethylaminomethyl(34) synthesis GTPase MnmE [Gammaproteobacteria bacterium]